VEFEPTANKWQGEICRGFQIHVTDPIAFKPYRAGLALLQAVMRCHSQSFQWKSPPYEYEHERMPIDLILGDQHLREELAAMVPLGTLESGWQAALIAFQSQRQASLLYA
jgi:uncharacterized protein YbbC (DUF1343 family)